MEGSLAKGREKRNIKVPQGFADWVALGDWGESSDDEEFVPEGLDDENSDLSGSSSGSESSGSDSGSGSESGSDKEDAGSGREGDEEDAQANGERGQKKKDASKKQQHEHKKVAKKKKKHNDGDFEEGDPQGKRGAAKRGGKGPKKFSKKSRGDDSDEDAGGFTKEKAGSPAKGKRDSSHRSSSHKRGHEEDHEDGEKRAKLEQDEDIRQRVMDFYSYEDLSKIENSVILKDRNIPIFTQEFLAHHQAAGEESRQVQLEYKKALAKLNRGNNIIRELRKEMKPLKAEHESHASTEASLQTLLKSSKEQLTTFFQVIDRVWIPLEGPQPGKEEPLTAENITNYIRELASKVRAGQIPAVKLEAIARALAAGERVPVAKKAAGENGAKPRNRSTPKPPVPLFSDTPSSSRRPTKLGEGTPQSEGRETPTPGLTRKESLDIQLGDEI